MTHYVKYHRRGLTTVVLVDEHDIASLPLPLLDVLLTINGWSVEEEGEQ